MSQVRCLHSSLSLLFLLFVPWSWPWTILQSSHSNWNIQAESNEPYQIDFRSLVLTLGSSSWPACTCSAWLDKRPRPVSAHRKTFWLIMFMVKFCEFSVSRSLLKSHYGNGTGICESFPPIRSFFFPTPYWTWRKVFV